MKAQFQYRTVIQSIASIRSDLEAFAVKWGIPAPELRQITVIVEELFSKIVRYAVEDDDHHLEISISKSDSEIIIEMNDDGTPFNPLENHSGHVHDPVSADDGNMGLSLVRAFSDSTQYTREDQKNILTIHKIIRSIPEKEQP
jgi:anti-sigma regulatory factor (Ser/Thr protein kinase)